MRLKTRAYGMLSPLYYCKSIHVGKQHCYACIWVYCSVAEQLELTEGFPISLRSIIFLLLPLPAQWYKSSSF